MAEKTAIEWCDHTFNPWRGCTKISPGCANCYAETMSHRNPSVLGEWGPSGKRVIASESYWRQPLAWNRKAREAGERRRVFCASLADVFEDRPELTLARCRLFWLIHQTPDLDWLLLTKRPEGILDRLRECGSVEDVCHGDGRINDGACLASQWLHGSPMPNVWLGVSAENQEQWDTRVAALCQIPARVRFVSVEPLLKFIDLWHPIRSKDGSGRVLRQRSGALRFAWECVFCDGAGYQQKGPCMVACDQCGQRWWPGIGIHWVIVGGESGPKARPMHPAWVRQLRDQCTEAHVPFLFKGWGEWFPSELYDFEAARNWRRLGLPVNGHEEVYIDAASGAVAKAATPGIPEASMVRVGKKAAGRLLDGRLHDEFPEVSKT